MRAIRSKRSLNTMSFFAAFVLAAVVPLAAHAGATAAQKCESGKNGAAGKYTACLLKAQSKFTGGGEVDTAGLDEALLACNDKYTSKWQSLEDKAGVGVCPSDYRWSMR